MLNRKGTMNTKGLLFILAAAVLTVILYFVFFSDGAEFVPRARKAIPNVQEAKAYDDLVAEIFQEKCVSCHGPNKKKGQLRLDNPAMIQKGGKSRNLLVAGSPDESELFIRIMYGLNDDDHMPPKEKSQLTKNEIALLHWWISEGNDFTKQVKEIKQSDSIKKLLASFQSSGDNSVSETASIPKDKVNPGNSILIDSLRAMDITVIPLAAGNNYLTVSFLNAKVNPDSVLGILTGLKDQVIFLKLSGSKLSDSGATAIAGLHHLTRLYLEKTKITDAGLQKLTTLKHLQYLNLTGTGVTIKGVMALKGLSELQSVYLYQTKIKTAGFIELKKAFPGVKVDSGGYNVPFIADDTVVNR
jgi:mono/diheme cytochrome c family protein